MIVVPGSGQKPSKRAVGGAELIEQVMGRDQTRSIEHYFFPTRTGPANDLVKFVCEV